MHILVSVLPGASLPPRLPHNIEQSSVCYPIGPWPTHFKITVNIKKAHVSTFSRKMRSAPLWSVL